MTKTCCNCHVEKSRSSFRDSSNTKDGLGSWCKDCCREKNRVYYQERMERLGREEVLRLGRESYEQNKDHKLDLAVIKREESPEQYQAYYLVRQAIRRGDLVRPTTCDNCGISCRPDAHHKDYLKPLEVTFLCRKCHVQATVEEMELVS